MKTLFILFVLIVSPAFSPFEEEKRHPDILAPDILAQGQGVEITADAFYGYLTSLYLHDPEGKALMEQLVREEAIADEMERRELVLSQKTLEQKIDELEARFRQESGGESGLDHFLHQNEVDRKVFIQALRLSLAHEIMARQDFEIDPDEAIPVEKLNIWLKERLSLLQSEPLTIDSGILAKVGSREISRTAYGIRLAAHLGPTVVADHLTELIGIALIRWKAQSLGLVLAEVDAEREIRERQAVLESMQGLEGITYERYLQASKGMDLEALRASAKFQGEVLLKKICETLHHEAFLQEFYEQNIDFFNQRFGSASRVSTIFLKAVKFPNAFISRKFEEAVDELNAIKTRIERGEVEFQEMARIYSEHESGKTGGDLGFLAPNQTGWEEVADAALKMEPGSLIGPLPTADGCHLFKVCGHRENPTYSAIHQEVVREARQRYYRQLLAEADVKRKF